MTQADDEVISCLPLPVHDWCVPGCEPCRLYGADQRANENHPEPKDRGGPSRRFNLVERSEFEVKGLGRRLFSLDLGRA
jgi:hypothetical protein